ncbi:MAG: cyclase family protein [Alphaproteobacteria bacterium]|nr:cyclase family protein [Alphaproteobacteria bacterium]
MRNVAIALTALLGSLAIGGQAMAACKDNWKDCAGKPWVDGKKMETPMGSKWWPNALWGKGDQAGSTNWYTKAEVVKRGSDLIKSGKIYRLGHDYHAGMPMFGARKFVLRIPGTPTGGPFGQNQIVYHDEFLATEIGQAGTQFDGLGHVGVQVGGAGDLANMRYYNGFTGAEIGSSLGLKKLGVEKLHPIFGRGILIDLAAARGVEAMKAGECASMADVKKALLMQGMADFAFKNGDAIMFRTGWEKYWDDPKAYNAGQPGICMDVARWVAEDVKAGVTGGDSWAATDPVPYPNEPACAFCVHNYLQTRHGVVNQENLRLKQLVDDKTYVFAYAYAPAPIRGGTGSNGSPMALR